MIGYLLMGLLSFQGGRAPIEERFRVDFVTLDIVAKDRRGNLVTDLKLSDFEVKENRKEVNVTFFETLDYQSWTNVDGDVQAIELKEAENLDSKRQQIILAMDFESLPRQELMEAFDTLQDFLKKLPNDTRYRINLYSMDYGSLTKGFTTDVDDAISALIDFKDNFLKKRLRVHRFDSDDFTPGGVRSGGKSRYATSRSNKGFSALWKTINDMSDFERALIDCQGYPAARDNYGGPCHCMAESAQEFLTEHQFRTERIVNELEILANKFEDDKGLKTMLLLSPGFAMNRMSGVNSLLRYYQSTVNPRECDVNAQDLNTDHIVPDVDFRRVAHACIRNRVVFHVFDIFNADIDVKRRFNPEHRAAPTRAVTGAYRTFSQEIASGPINLADESGGSFIQSNNVRGNLIKVLEENRFFYVLGYQSPKGRAGKFRNIKVKVKRKGITLSYRKGYYGI